MEQQIKKGETRLLVATKCDAKAKFSKIVADLRCALGI